jgi:hypothetical protein
MPSTPAAPATATPPAKREGRLEIEPEEGGLEAIISELKKKP